MYRLTGRAAVRWFDRTGIMTHTIELPSAAVGIAAMKGTSYLSYLRWEINMVDSLVINTWL